MAFLLAYAAIAVLIGWRIYPFALKAAVHVLTRDDFAPFHVETPVRYAEAVTVIVAGLWPALVVLLAVRAVRRAVR